MAKVTKYIAKYSICFLGLLFICNNHCPIKRQIMLTVSYFEVIGIGEYFNVSTGILTKMKQTYIEKVKYGICLIFDNLRSSIPKFNFPFNVYLRQLFVFLTMLARKATVQILRRCSLGLLRLAERGAYVIDWRHPPPPRPLEGQQSEIYSVRFRTLYN